MAAVVVLAAWLAHQASKNLRGSAEQRSTLLRRYGRWRRYHAYALIVLFLSTLYLGGWGWAVSEALYQVPGVEVLILTPLLAGLVLSWALLYEIERAAHDTIPLSCDVEPFLGRWAYVVLNIRQNLLLVFPPLLLLIIQQTVIWMFPALQANAWFLPLFVVALLAGIFIGIPLVLRLLLGLRPLPEGPLRDRLLATSRRLRFRCNDILLWNTRNAMANAMVTGPLPYLRYVVLTDRLVREMTPDEVEAVFGHEMGHIKHHHMLFYFGFLVGSLIVLAGAWEGMSEVVNRHLGTRLTELNAFVQSSEFPGLLPMVALLATYVFVVFGFLSRRCERQADIYGCRTVSPQVFIEALEKVALLNGLSRDRPGWLSSWQHSTIARRVDFLQQMCADPGLEGRFQRRVRLIKWSMAFTLAGVMVTMITVLGGDKVLDILSKL